MGLSPALAVQLNRRWDGDAGEGAGEQLTSADEGLELTEIHQPFS